MSKTSPQDAPTPTVWTAEVTDVPSLSRLDRSAPARSPTAARKLAAEVKKKIERDLAPYGPRSSVDSLRKLVR